MDVDRFDVLTRTIARPISRRSSLGALAIGGMLALRPGLAERSGLARKDKKRRRRTRTVRKLVTRTFTNPALIDVIDDEPGLATDYPSIIEVSGFANGTITDMNLTLRRITFDDPEELHVYLVPAHLPGKNAIVMSDVGNDNGISDVTVTLDDQAASPMPDAASESLTSGTFQPTNAQDRDDQVPAPAPPPSGNTELSVFNGANPNGAWQLFVFDEKRLFFGGDGAQTIEGWSLQITAEVDVKRQVRKKR